MRTTPTSRSLEHCMSTPTRQVDSSDQNAPIKRRQRDTLLTEEFFEEGVKLTPGLDPAQLSNAPIFDSHGGMETFKASEEDVIVRRELHFTLPTHSPLLRSARPSVALAETRSALLQTPVLPTDYQGSTQQAGQLNSPYIRMCAQLEEFVETQTEVVDSLLFTAKRANLLAVEREATETTQLTPELQKARLGVNGPRPVSLSSTAPSNNNPTANNAQSTPSRSLWLGNVDPTLTESEIRIAFEPFGPIELVRLLPAKECAFVNYYSLEDALRARTGMQGMPLGNMILRIGFGRIDNDYSTGVVGSTSNMPSQSQSGDTRSIWIGNLVSEVDEEELMHHFVAFGPIESCRVLGGKNCAFVNFYTAEAAAAARQAMNGAMIGGNVIKTGHAKDYGNTTSNINTTAEQPITSAPGKTTFASVLCESPTFDGGVLRDYRRRIESDPQAEIPRVLDEIGEADLAALAVDAYGNILLQKIIERASLDAQLRIHSGLKGKLAQTSMNKNGTWVVQKLLSYALTAQLQAECLRELKEDCSGLLQDQFGNYVIQTALQVQSCPAAVDELIASIAQHARALATGRFSSRALKSILEAQPPTSPALKTLLSALARESVWLAIDPNGVLVLQWMLDCSELPGRIGMISTPLQGRVGQVALTKHGCSILARILGSTGEPSARDVIIWELYCGGGEAELMDLLAEPGCCALLCKGYQMSKPATRLQLAQKLRKPLLETLKHQTGLSDQQLLTATDPITLQRIPIHLQRLYQEVIQG